MGLSQTSAVFVLLFVTFLWGSWFQAVKHTGNYPIYVFLNWMYLFSVVIVWGAIFIFEDKMIPDGVFNEIASDPGRVALVFLCGAVYAVGMQIQLSAVSRVGLILSSSITSTCSILSGVIVSAILGGVPEGASLTMIMMSAVLLIGGTVVCQISGTMRDKDIKKGENKKTPLATKKQDIILLIFASGILQPFFSIASSVGLKTDLRPEGFSSFTCMGILCLGAFVGTAGFSAIVVTKEKMWKKVIHPDVKIGVIIGSNCCILSFWRKSFKCNSCTSCQYCNCYRYWIFLWNMVISLGDCIWRIFRSKKENFRCSWMWTGIFYCRHRYFDT